MAEIIQDEGQGKKKGKKRAKKHGTHIDMTPMVDLACLLLTFFMLTTAFSKPKVMEIVLPEKPKPGEEKNQPPLDKSRALHIILIDNDKLLWYKGLADPTKPPLPTLTETDYSKDGIRRVLLQRNKALYLQIEQMNKEVIEGKMQISQDSVTGLKRSMMKEDKAGPVVLIKAGDNVKYRNIVDIIDEMAITNVARYALVDMNDLEKKMVAGFKASTSGTAIDKKH
jgi:biopolymer transport protein ExbD